MNNQINETHLEKNRKKSCEWKMKEICVTKEVKKWIHSQKLSLNNKLRHLYWTYDFENRKISEVTPQLFCYEKELLNQDSSNYQKIEFIHFICSWKNCEKKLHWVEPNKMSKSEICLPFYFLSFALIFFLSLWKFLIETAVKYQFQTSQNEEKKCIYLNFSLLSFIFLLTLFQLLANVGLGNNSYIYVLNYFGVKEVRFCMLSDMIIVLKQTFW